MTTASQIDPREIGRSTDTSKMTPATAAAMCAGMPDLWYKAAALKWADDWSGANDLEYRLWMAAVDLANYHGWHPPKGKEYLRRMAGLAIAEMARPADYRKEKPKYKFLGMSQPLFNGHWKDRYELIYQVLEAWAGEGYRYIQKKNVDKVL